MKNLSKIKILIIGLVVLSPRLILAYSITVNNKTGQNLDVTLEYAVCPEGKKGLKSGEKMTDVKTGLEAVCCLKTARFKANIPRAKIMKEKGYVTWPVDYTDVSTSRDYWCGDQDITVVRGEDDSIKIQ